MADTEREYGEYVLLDVDDGVARLTLNDPDRYNPWSDEIVDELLPALRAAERAEPRVLVVSGNGPAFSAGGDVDRMREQIDDDIAPDERVRLIERENPIIETVAKFPAPTVAKIDGPAAGVGANLAIACDILLAREDAFIMFAFTNVGINVDGGTSALLPRIVGNNVAKELVYTAEKVPAERAKDLGICNHVYGEAEFEERVEEKVQELASRPTLACRYSKKLIDESHTKSLEQALEDEAVYQAALVSSHDHEEGVTAFLEDREPSFRGE
ncbi:enoyl-CoA hydratase/isomerase family protein [Halobium palmae]|uniref:Enoyl-CoA hydratase/isomerase family protein n=1 Tax=Halobium palmae TaxID=1776492 RepID=A0ABD5RWX7_9EURY